MEQDLAMNYSLPAPALDQCSSKSNVHRNHLLWKHKFWLDGYGVRLRFCISNSLHVDVNIDCPWSTFWVVRVHRLCELRDWDVTSSILGALYWVFIDLRKDYICQSGTCLPLLYRDDYNQKELIRTASLEPMTSNTGWIPILSVSPEPDTR